MYHDFEARLIFFCKAFLVQQSACISQFRINFCLVNKSRFHSFNYFVVNDIIMNQLISFQSVFVIVSVRILHCSSLPIRRNSATDDDNHGRNLGASALLPFLKRFGYLESSNSSEFESDALYTQESIEEAVIEMQKFGSIPQTGKLDEETLKLLTAPRCGLPDVIRETGKGSRRKRFVIGANGWNKRMLTYRIENWAPELDESSVLSEVKKAFNTWADYSRLRFVGKPRWIHDDVDISISFGRGHHGDRYPFDGPGGVLAHAFFPYGYGSLGGDIHFDVDEKWRSNGNSTEKFDTSAVSFFAVAVHEIGHSLGLGHSPSRDSVMFPYYQFDDQGESSKLRLGYDDIMAMYQLYIQRYIEDFPDHEPEDPDTPSTTEKTDFTSTKRSTYPEYTTQSTSHITLPTRRHNYPTSESTSTTYGHSYSTEITSPYSYSTDESTFSGTFSTARPTTGYFTSATERSDDKLVPDLCVDGYDTITYIRNEIFVFKNEYMWRFREMGIRERQYPVKIERLFPMLKDLSRIDAAFENDEGRIYFFSGEKYWIFNEFGQGIEEPSSILDFSLPNTLQKIDAAFIWEKNKKTYFFSGNLFWRYNGTTNIMDKGYPKGIDRWKGLPANGIDSVMKWSDGRTYFFKNNDFWRFDDTMVETEAGFPLPTSSFWLGC